MEAPGDIAAVTEFNNSEIEKILKKHVNFTHFIVPEPLTQWSYKKQKIITEILTQSYTQSNTFPDWSPDGARIAYVSNAPGDANFSDAILKATAALASVPLIDIGLVLILKGDRDHAQTYRHKPSAQAQTICHQPSAGGAGAPANDRERIERI